MSEIIKSREHVKNSLGTYDTVYRETLAELVKDTNGNTAQEHIDAQIKSNGGAHGFRYNAADETFEVYNPDTDEWEEVASGGGGVALGPVTGLNVLEASEKIHLKWSDPENVVVDGVILAEWAGTLLVRKAGSMPANRRDGVLIVDNKVKDKYKTTYFNDTGLSNGMVYYYKFFPYSKANVYTNHPNDEDTATPHAVAPSNVSGLDVTTLNGRVQLKWTDPNDTVSDGITLSVWAGSKVVFKIGSAPTNPNDGTLVLNSTTKNMYSTTGLEITGLTNGTTYYFAVFPYATEASGGAVNTNASNVITGVPNRIVISTVPAQSGSLTYNGGVQSPSWSNYNSAQLTIGGVNSGTNAGTYTATFTPTNDYKWSDGSTSAKSVTWSIGKAAGSLSISPTSITLDMNTKNATISVNRAGDGAITATSSNTGVVTVSVSGTTVTVNNVNQTNGSATVTINVAAGTNHNAPTNKTCSVTANFVLAVLNDNTWDVIKQVSDAGQGANYWKVGDFKNIALNGTIGTVAVNSTYRVFILGFNHNSAREGGNRIHFQFGKTTGGVDICLVDSGYGGGYTDGQKRFNMNHSSNTNSGGWNGCNLRTDILGQSVGVANTFLMALPADLRAVLKTVTKYSDNTGGGSDSAGYVTATTDLIFLLAEFEVQGTRTYANSAERNFQLQYDYYKNGNSKVKYYHSSTGSAAYWWLRSVSSSNSSNFCYVTADGSASANNAYYSHGVSPGFCV